MEFINNSQSTKFIDNKPPVFKAIKTEKVFKGQDNELQIVGTDPENKTITYGISGNPQQTVTIADNGTVFLKPNRIGQFTLTIRATDICGAFTDQELVIDSLQCPCEEQNGGYCIFEDTLNYTFECICPEGCTGPR